MQNIEFKKTGNKLTITVDLSKDGELSSSGKNIIIATTRGNQSLPDDDNIVVGLNVYKRKPKEAK